MNVIICCVFSLSVQSLQWYTHLYKVEHVTVSVIADFILQQLAVACILQVPIWTGDVPVIIEIQVLTVNSLSFVCCSLCWFVII